MQQHTVLGLPGVQIHCWYCSGGRHPQPAGAELQHNTIPLYLGKGEEVLLLLGTSFSVEHASEELGTASLGLKLAWPLSWLCDLR